MLESLLGMPQSLFEKSYRSRNVLYVQGGARKYADLFSWRILNDILDGSSGVLDNISLIREGQKLDRRFYVTGTGQKLVPGALRKALSEGSTLVVNNATESSAPIREVNDKLCNELGVNVWTNVYVSWTTHKGFLTHWDGHDVLVLQTEGEKDWSVFCPEREHGLELDIENRDIKSPNDLQLVWEGRLKKGDVLYIPRGWWHHARATGTGSIHMTLGIDCVTGIQAIECLAQEARKASIFRRDLPSLNGEGAEQAVAAFEAELASFVAEHIDGLVRRTWEDHFGRLRVQMRHHLPFALEPDQLQGRNFKVQFAGLAPDVPIGMQDDRFSITAGGRRWKFAKSVYPIIEQLLSGDVIAIAELEARCAPDVAGDTCRLFVFELLNEGLINIVEMDAEGSTNEAKS